MGKKVYIAVGSSAVKGMMRLIRKYKEEGLFLNTRDSFIGLDSDRGQLRALEAMSPDRAKVNSVMVRLNDSDASAKYARRFQPLWRRLEITGAGVGGDRTLSFASLEWTGNQFLKQEVENAEQVIVIGTAFGGTSTGMFWNLAQKIRSLTPPTPQGKEQRSVYAMLVFPAIAGDTRSYPRLFMNMIAFLQDMEVLASTSFLNTKTDIPFVAPAFPENSDGKVFKTWRGEAFSSLYSYLPFDRIFAIPTPKEGEALVGDIIAEQAFLLGHLAFWDQARFKAEIIDNAEVQRGSEDSPFAAFSMIIARSGKNNLIKRNVYNWLHSEWEHFISDTSTDAGKRYVFDVLTEIMREGADVEEVSQKIEETRKMFAVRLKDMAVHLEAGLESLRNVLSNYKLNWPTVNDLLARLESKRYSEEGVRINIEDIIEGFNELKLDIIEKSLQIDPYKELMQEYIAKARKVIAKRKKSFVSNLMGYGVDAESEVRHELKNSLNLLLDKYVLACQAEASKNRVGEIPRKDEVLSAREIPGFGHIPGIKLVDAYLKKMSSEQTGGAKASFLYDTVSAGKVDLSEAKQFVPPATYTGLIMAGLQKHDEPAINDLYETEISDVIEMLKKRLEEEKRDANPLKQIKVSLNDAPNLEPSARMFIASNLGKYHKAFYVSYGLADKPQWKRITDDFGLESFNQIDLRHNPEKAFEPGDYPGNRYFVGNVEDAGDVQGIWLGEAALSLKGKEVVPEIYSETETIEYERQAATQEKNQSVPMRLMTLPQAIAFGLVLGAVQKRLVDEAKKLDRNPATVTVASLNVKQNRGRKLELTGLDNPLGDYLASGKEAFLSCPCEWITPVMDWLRGPFWEDMDVPALAEELGLERNICRRLQLYFPTETREKIKELASKLYNRVNVEFN